MKRMRARAAVLFAGILSGVLTGGVSSAAALSGVHGQSAAREETPLFNPQRSTLYTPPELWQGFDAAKGDSGWDAAVYRQYLRTGKFYPSRAMARARSLHDEGISAALNELVLTARRHGQNVVGVMGNAREDLRCSVSYRQTAQLGWELARSGYLVATGGGPGEMEAANLGAYLSGEPASAIDTAIGVMRARASKGGDAGVCRYANHAVYMAAAFDVLQRFPRGAENLGVPTWFYGQEPPNLFATRVAMYFSNAQREDVLLAIDTGGVVFTEGRAGLRQEIFQKAAQEDFASFCYVSPMVFLGVKEFQRSGLYPLVANFAAQAPPPVGDYRGFLDLTDSVSQAVAFLESHPPRFFRVPGSGCELRGERPAPH